MATKNMAYDHPAYLTPYVLGGRLSGAAGSFKFAAFSALLVKSHTVAMRTVGTSAADAITAFKISGTTTTTQIIGTMVGTSIASTNVVGTMTLAQGDVLEITKGTDATDDLAYTVEMVLVPGSNITA